MKVIPTEIEGVVLLEPDVFGDERGYFFESYSEQSFGRLVRPVRFVQDNESMSKYGVLRGLHFQRGAHAQSKLVRVVPGPRAGRRGGHPPGLAHVRATRLCGALGGQQTAVLRAAGLCARLLGADDEAVFQYKCDNLYAPESEGAIAWDDPTLGIDWRLAAGGCRALAQGQRPPAAGGGRGTVRLQYGLLCLIS